MRGDGDPLDICVISERAIDRADITLTATVVGGLQMLDGDEADDKIIGVLARDPFWGEVTDVGGLPTGPDRPIWPTTSKLTSCVPNEPGRRHGSPSATGPTRPGWS